MSYHVYIALDAEDRPLYIGYTAKLNRRIADHQRQARWWDDAASISATEYETEAEARRAERLAIFDLKPKHNIYRFWPENVQQATITLPETLMIRLGEEAQALGITVSLHIRNCLMEFLLTTKDEGEDACARS